MKGLRHLEDLRVDEEFLKKEGERVWTDFTWLNALAGRLPGSKEGNYLKKLRCSYLIPSYLVDWLIDRTVTVQKVSS